MTWTALWVYTAIVEVFATPSSPALAATVEANNRTLVGEPASAPNSKLFALTLNPLNLVIGRYAFNFEYEPIPHHDFILTPHFDYASGSPTQDATSPLSETLKGFGGEIGYRYYSGDRSFDGFFAGPALLIAEYEVARKSVSGQATSNDFGSLGVAFDVGWQWQMDHLVIGLGTGIQYTKVKYNLGYDAWLDYHAGGGWRPRLLLNLGYSF